MELSPAQKALAATALAVLTAVGAVASSNLVHDITLDGSSYTKSEYQALKESLIKDISDKTIDYEKYNVWRAIVNKHITEDCGGSLTLYGATKDTIVDQVDQLTLNDKCK